MHGAWRLTTPERPSGRKIPDQARDCPINRRPAPHLLAPHTRDLSKRLGHNPWL